MENITITEEIIAEHGITGEEYEIIKKMMGREPNINELGVFSVMWSEHCGYKNTKPLLKTLPTKGEHILQGPGENAGIVDIGDGYAVVFKIESHNHPSAVEPYQGAATGVGGILRDIFTMGARPVACLNSLRFGTLDNERTKFLVKGVVKGIGDYGNCVGIPTIAGEVYFDKSYQQNILVNAMTVGLIKKENIVRAKAAGIGNPVVYYGSTTGRDGIHGATFASVELSEGEDKRPSVQVGDPFTEKLLMEATLELIEKSLLVGVQDMGAAGLTSSSSEMASRGEVGIEMSLDAIPKRADDLTAYEMLLSESQERMLAVVEPEKLEEVERVLKKWDLNCVVIGKVVEGNMLTVKHHGEVVADIPVRAITDDVPQYTREGKVPAYISEIRSRPIEKINKKADEILLSLLDAPNIASKRWVYKQYDYMVGTDTVVRPGLGAGVLRIKGTNRGIAMKTDCNGRYCYINPYKGALIAVCEAYRNLSAVGALPLAVTNNLNFANPEKAGIYWQLSESIRALREGCTVLNTPVTGGNCSMYNESGGEPIFPTPVIGMVGTIDDVDKAVSASGANEGDILYIIGETKDELGGSEYLALTGEPMRGDSPDIDAKTELKHGVLIRSLIEDSLLSASSDISEGGIAVAIAEMCIKGEHGANISLLSNLDEHSLLFSESQSRYLIAVPADKQATVEKKISDASVMFEKAGVVSGKNAPFVWEGVFTLENNTMAKYYYEALPSRLDG